MNNVISKLIAKHIREFYFGDNWTTANLKSNVSTLDWEQAVNKINKFNTIAELTYHIHYYTRAILQVLKGNELNANDKFSFDIPPILSQDDWENFLKVVWKEAEEFIEKVESIDDAVLLQVFSQEKYGNHYRNLHGFIEHAHYHLGQIALIKKLILEE